MSDLTIQRESSKPRLTYAVFGIAGAALTLQLLTLYFLYHPDHFIFECRGHASPLFCEALSSGVMRAGAVIFVTLMILAARPAVFRNLLSYARPGWIWVAAQVAGFLAILSPLTFLVDDVAPSVFLAAVVLWLAGLFLATVGTAFFFVTPKGWGETAKKAGPWLIVPALLAAFVPDVAPWIRDEVQYLWHVNIVTEATFWATAAVLSLTGEPIYTDLAGPYIGLRDFIVGVGRQCSGVEGFILITVFLLGYFWLFRKELRFPRALLLLPLGLALSWCLNVVRIAVLIMIGAYSSPELAIEGFHSHAGWLMFTILSVSFAAVAHRISWFRASTAEGPSTGAEPSRLKSAAPFFEDPIAAQIFPFIVFMASALLASTFSQTPAVLYPLRAIAMAAVIVMFWPVLRTFKWRLDPVAMCVGGVVGFAWLATAPAAAEADVALLAILDALPPWLFAVWAVSRIVGTTILVPIIEEQFFRGYLLRRLDIGGMAMRILAVAVSSALFAALHDRWLAAAMAGALFGLLMIRHGRVTDAIVAHAIANAIIAAFALLQGDWSVI